MIRSRKGNRVFDFACWKYPAVFKRVVDGRKEVAVECTICDEMFNFKRCKDVDDHTEEETHKSLEKVKLTVLLRQNLFKQFKVLNIFQFQFETFKNCYLKRIVKIPVIVKLTKKAWFYWFYNIKLEDIKFNSEILFKK